MPHIPSGYPFVMPVALAENDSFGGGSPDLHLAQNFNSSMSAVAVI